MIRIGGVLAIGMSLGFYLAQGMDEPAPADDRVQAIPVRQQAEPNPIPQATLMQAKLSSCRMILEGLVTEDYEQIRAGAEDVRQIAESTAVGESGNESTDHLSAHFQREFLRLSEQLIHMAEDKNMPGAAYSYNSLTATCIACHDHLRRDGEESNRSLRSTIFVERMGGE